MFRENLDSLCLPCSRPRGRGDRPQRCPTPKPDNHPHSCGSPLRAAQGGSTCVAVNLFSIFLFVLYGDAFLVFYTIRKDKVLEILTSFV